MKERAFTAKRLPRAQLLQQWADVIVDALLAHVIEAEVICEIGDRRGGGYVTIGRQRTDIGESELLGVEEVRAEAIDAGRRSRSVERGASAAG
jgi:hypothetical protein